MPVDPYVSNHSSYVATLRVETLVELLHLPADSEDIWPMNKLSEFVKIAEAARILGVWQDMLRAWTESGNSVRRPRRKTARIRREP